MAAVPFGISVSDFIAGITLVQGVIIALNDTAGSKPEYRRLVTELINLDKALTGAHNLRVHAALNLLVSPRVIRVVHKGMHLRVFYKVCRSIKVLLYSINTVRCSLVLR
jgi:hypothetical protein